MVVVKKLSKQDSSVHRHRHTACYFFNGIYINMTKIFSLNQNYRQLTIFFLGGGVGGEGAQISIKLYKFKNKKMRMWEGGRYSTVPMRSYIVMYRGTI